MRWRTANRLDLFIRLTVCCCTLAGCVPRVVQATDPPARGASSGREGHNDQKICEQIRENVARLLGSDGFEAVMKQAGIDPEGGSLVDLEKLDRLRQSILMKAGATWKDTSATVRDAATAAAFDGVLKVRRRHEGLRERAGTLLASQGVMLLKGETSAGFEDLSNDKALLDETKLKALADSVIRRSYPNEPQSVKATLAWDMENDLRGKSTTAKTVFRRHVRRIFFGEPGFGTREAFLSFEGQEARSKAIEEAIWRVIRKHAKYGRALRKPFTQAIVAEQAKDLAEAIKNVPSPR